MRPRAKASHHAIPIMRFLKSIYLKLFRINDTPHKIASGFGVGVFLGIMPGMGPIAALILAFILRINRASALLGSILTNTWLSIPVFLASAKIGSILTGIGLDNIKRDWAALLKDFHWAKIFQASVYNVIFPIASGYLVVSFLMGALVYIATYIILSTRRRKL